MRVSLLTRLLGASVLIAVLAIAATAWLATRTTTNAIEQEQGRTLATDNQIYTTLLGYAATHPSWDGVGPTLETLAQHTDRRITLLAHDRTPIADSSTGPLPSIASAVVDPLAVDPALVPDAAADRIDSRAVGPFRLPDNEKTYLDGLAAEALQCVRTRSGGGEIVTTPTGRPRVAGPNGYTAASCGGAALDDPTPTEQAALTQLSALVNGCLDRNGLPPVRLALDRSWTWTAPGPAQAGIENTVTGCVASARHEQLTPFVAPAAMLFVTTEAGAAAPSPFDLSAGNQGRIALAAAAVLVVTVAITVLAGRRLTRPLRALTAAAQRMRDGVPDTRVRVRGHDEIARLAAAFNDMAVTRERMERQRNDMVGDIAHELRTPLSNIRGWLEATQDGVSTLDPPLVASLLEEARLLQHVIDDLQDLALADAGTLRLHVADVDVPELLADLPLPPNAVVAAEPLTVRADPMRLRQMLGNLVANAVRHTPPEGTITLRAYPSGDVGVLEVSDTGTGISPDDLPHVFDRFWRAEKSRNRATGGSGLGLAIVRKLAESHHGTATVESVPGEGATFRLRLPRTR
ncbi:sensor histidine kinase [Actinophytocola oryzae]|uniref:histidine kinase n=1 Tax=Actinophytocola oryzae TaxID=502181 RepID=A0A4R7W5N1_9PSEU|nr:HAMP domain-containing sensor histidine kinase [Actinophytocola oryzae]TDV57289.1 two-component system sensor histidine kinase BaeS [Actinophytocola oryzae]